MSAHRSERNETSIAVGLVAITFVGAMISSLGAPLIPAIAASTGSTLSQAQWTLTLTVLVSVAATPVMGRLADTRYRRATILVALSLVTVGGVLAAIGAQSLPLLLVGRALQGFGQGLAPMMISIAHTALTHGRQRSTIAVLSITNAAGVGLGYPITGLLAQWVGIAGAFWIGGVLTSVAALIVAALIVPVSRDLAARRIDILGAVMFAIAIGSLLLALAQGDEWGWGSVGVITLLVVAVVVGVAWTFYQLHTQHPLVDLRLLKRRSVLTADITVLLGGVGMYLLLTLATRIIQAPPADGLGYGAVVTGLAMLPMSAGSLAANWIAKWLRNRIPSIYLLPTAAVVMIIAMILFTLMRHNLVALLIAMAIAGIGIGLVFALVPTLIVGHVPRGDTGSALSFNQIFRYVGYSFGSVLTASILQAGTLPGATYPSGTAYAAAGLTGAVIWVIVGIASATTAGTSNTPPTEKGQP